MATSTNFKQYAMQIILYLLAFAVCLCVCKISSYFNEAAKISVFYKYLLPSDLKCYWKWRGMNPVFSPKLTWQPICKGKMHFVHWAIELTFENFESTDHVHLSAHLSRRKNQINEREWLVSNYAMHKFIHFLILILKTQIFLCPSPLPLLICEVQSK